METPTDDERLATRVRAATRFQRLVHLTECTSTQDLAAADRDGPPGIWWADHQQRGRGRQQRVWHDRPGRDLAVTFGLRVAVAVPIALAAVVPLCVADAIEPRIGQRLRVKWPNDVFADGRKLAGVLIDADGTGAFSIGVGINVNGRELPAEVRDLATSMRILSGRDHDRHELLLDLARHLDAAIGRLEAGDHDELLARYRDRLGLMGDRVLVRAATTAVGRLIGLDFTALSLDDGSTHPLGLVRELRPAQ